MGENLVSMENLGNVNLHKKNKSNAFIRTMVFLWFPTMVD